MSQNGKTNSCSYTFGHCPTEIKTPDSPFGQSCRYNPNVTNNSFSTGSSSSVFGSASPSTNVFGVASFAFGPTSPNTNTGFTGRMTTTTTTSYATTNTVTTSTTNNLFKSVPVVNAVSTGTTTSTFSYNTFTFATSNSAMVVEPNIKFGSNSPFGISKPINTEKETNIEEQSSSISSKDIVMENEVISLQSHIPLANVSYCNTSLKSKKYEFVWKIDDFKKFHRLEDELIAEMPESLSYKIKMKVFRASDNNLHDNPENNTSLLKDKIAFYIIPNVGFKCTFTVNIIKDIKFIPYKVASGTGVISTLTLLYETTAEELYKFLYKEDTLLIEFILEVHHKCSLSTTCTNSSKPIDSNVKSEDVDSNKCCKSDEEQSIKFIVNERDYVVPIKLLHDTNSSYFNELINNKEKEKDITDVIISDRKQTIFAIMVSFIKIGLIPAIISVNDLKDLLRLAHKFDVQSLKLICEECLLSYITPSTAIDFMQLAVSCDAKCLEKNVENFLKIHMKDISSLKEYQLLSPEHSQKMKKLKEEAEKSMVEERVLFN